MKLQRRLLMLLLTLLLGSIGMPLCADEADPPPAGTIHRAVYDGKFATVKQMLTRDPSLLNQPLKANGHFFADATPLAVAVISGYIEITKFLIAKGADVNKGTHDSPHLVSVAAEQGNMEMIRLLIAKGAKVENGALSSAVNGKKLAIIQLLIEKGADLNAKKDEMLPRACINCFSEDKEMMRIIRFLLNKGADAKKLEAMAGAAQRGNVELVQLLLDHGADASEFLSTYQADQNLRTVLQATPPEVMALLQKAANRSASGESSASSPTSHKPTDKATGLELLSDKDAELSNSFSALEVATAREKEDQAGIFDGIITQIKLNSDKSATRLEFSKDGGPAILAYILKANLAKFPKLDTLKGKRVLIRGTFVIINNQPKVEITDPSQVKIIEPEMAENQAEVKSSPSQTPPQKVNESNSSPTDPKLIPSSTTQKEIEACYLAIAKATEEKKPDAILAFWSDKYSQIEGKEKWDRAKSVKELKSQFPGNELAPSAKFLLRSLTMEGRDRVIVEVWAYRIVPNEPSEPHFNKSGNSDGYYATRETWIKSAGATTWKLLVVEDHYPGEGAAWEKFQDEASAEFRNQPSKVISGKKPSASP